MDIHELAHVIEAILFVAGEPVDVREIQRALEVTELETAQAIDSLDSDSAIPPTSPAMYMFHIS